MTRMSLVLNSRHPNLHNPSSRSQKRLVLRFLQSAPMNPDCHRQILILSLSRAPFTNPTIPAGPSDLQVLNSLHRFFVILTSFDRTMELWQFTDTNCSSAGKKPSLLKLAHGRKQGEPSGRGDILLPWLATSSYRLARGESLWAVLPTSSIRH